MSRASFLRDHHFGGMINMQVSVINFLADVMADTTSRLEGTVEVSYKVVPGRREPVSRGRHGAQLRSLRKRIAARNPRGG